MRLGTITYHPATTKIIMHGKWLWPEYFCVLFNLGFGINKLDKKGGFRNPQIEDFLVNDFLDSPAISACNC
jgi:hypothetical protein